MQSHPPLNDRPATRTRRTRPALTLAGLALLAATASAEVPRGSQEDAEKYYKVLAKTLHYPAAGKEDTITQTTLDDLARYLGYGGMTAQDLESLSPADLINKGKQVGAKPGDVLVTRFFAPKIMNMLEPEATRKLGWRKLVRLQARPASDALKNKIASATILFNIFTDPNSSAAPFGPTDFSVNTQVMLVSDPRSVRPLPPKIDAQADRDSIYWLDYQGKSAANPGKLGFALTAFFDANELSPASGGAQDYFVPDGCAACHGANLERSMLNYLDTDHWFDRLNTDFQQLRNKGLALLVDAGTNDPASPQFKAAFAAIRQFNTEADQQAVLAQPKHDEALAAAKWLEVHTGNEKAVPIAQRAIGPAPQWSGSSPDAQVLSALNQYCFRCHGTIKFSVFNKQAVKERWFNLKERIQPDAPVGLAMPPDRPLPDDVRALLLNYLP